MGLIKEIKDEINRTVATQELGLGKNTTTVFDFDQQVVFVIEEKNITGGKILTTAIDNKGMVGGEWIE